LAEERNHNIGRGKAEQGYRQVTKGVFHRETVVESNLKTQEKEIWKNRRAHRGHIHQEIGGGKLKIEKN